MTRFDGGCGDGAVGWRVRYLHQNSGAIARFHPTTRAQAIEIARQLIFDGESDVFIEDPDGTAFTVEAVRAGGRQSRG